MIKDTCRCGSSFMVVHEMACYERDSYAVWIEEHRYCRENEVDGNIETTVLGNTKEK